MHWVQARLGLTVKGGNCPSRSGGSWPLPQELPAFSGGGRGGAADRRNGQKVVVRAETPA